MPLAAASRTGEVDILLKALALQQWTFLESIACSDVPAVDKSRRSLQLV